MVCSAAATMLPRGALTTRIPRRVAAATSMLSTPTPARPTTRSLLPASMTGAVTRVSLRTTSASKSGIPSMSSAWPRRDATVTSPARRRRSRPSSASGSATRILAIAKSLAGGGEYSLQRRGDRGRAAPLGRRDVELFQRLLQRPDHLDDITLGDGAEVSDPDHVPAHLALAPGDHDAVLGVEERAQRRDVDAWRRDRGRHRVGAITFARVKGEAQRFEARLRRPRQPRVALIYVRQPLFLKHAQAFLHRERDRDRGV